MSRISRWRLDLRITNNIEQGLSPSSHSNTVYHIYVWYAKGTGALTVKEYLNQARDLDKLIKAKKEQILRLNDERMNISSVLSIAKVQASHKNDKIAELTAMILDLQDIYAVDVTRRLRLKYDIQILIDSLANQTQQVVLTERYVNFRPWEEICYVANYSWDSLHRIHRAALKAIYDQYPDRFDLPIKKSA